jgi:hypothetical protein
MFLRPDSYLANEIDSFKHFMLGIIDRHNESLIVEESPLQFLARSQSNLLTLQLQHVPHPPKA